MEKKFRTLSACLRRGRLSILFALLFALQTGYGTPAAAQDTAAGISGQTCSATASGKVTDETGTPVSGVVVSDGRNCVATDKKGRYTLRCDPSATHLFISVPAGYETTGQQGFGSYPDFYVPIELAAGNRGNSAPISGYAPYRSPNKTSPCCWSATRNPTATSRSSAMNGRRSPT